MSGTYITRKSTAQGKRDTLNRRAARWLKYNGA